MRVSRSHRVLGLQCGTEVRVTFGFGMLTTITKATFSRPDS